MANGDDSGGEDFAFVVLLVAGAYFFYQWFRGQGAAAAEGTFPSSAPADSGATGILNILVPMQLSSAGAAFIKRQEGLSLSAYADGSGQSIGYGHHIQLGENIQSPITQEEADALFDSDISSAVQAVSNAVKVQVSQDQFDALVDFAYNVGAPAFRNSTLLTLLNQGNFAGAAQQFSRWIYSNGSINQGLIARRDAEAGLFNGGSA
jgi:lysozyme